MTTETPLAATPRMKPQDFAQLIRMGRGWAITRNSATLAVTDYEKVGREIVEALNAKRENARLREALASVVQKWEVLPSAHYKAAVIENWLSGDMFPAIEQARAALVQS